MDIKQKANKIETFCKEKQPTILTVGGAITLLGATVSGIVATIKSTRMVDAEERRLGRRMTKKELFKLVWKNYIVTAGAAVAGTTSVIIGQKQNNKRIAFVTAAGEIATSTASAAINELSEYKKHVAQKIGDEAANDIKKAVDDKIHADGDKTTEETRKDNVLCICDNETSKIIYEEGISGRRFTARPIDIEKAEVRLTAEMQSRGWINENNIHEALGLAPTDNGDRNGYTQEMFLNSKEGKYMFKFRRRTWIDAEGYPVIVLVIDADPIEDYRRYEY